jgi:hypothetical protein
MARAGIQFESHLVGQQVLLLDFIAFPQQILFAIESVMDILFPNEVDRPNSLTFGMFQGTKSFLINHFNDGLGNGGILSQ